MRTLLVLLHRWAGLGIALFLLVAGLTGAVISWDHELDAWLNPHLTQVSSSGPLKSPLQLADQIEARYPQIRISSLPLVTEPGHSLAFGVEAKVDPATGKLFKPGFNQIFIDPHSGTELGRRDWGAVWPLSRENFVSFLYVLHFSLHLPEVAGIDRWGVWLMGVVALIWTFDCFTGFYLSLPVPATGATAPRKSWWRRWLPAWKVRIKNGPYKLNFDLHRAGALWLWSLLLVVAFTAFSLNLYREVFFPLASLVSNVTPTPFDTRQPVAEDKPIMPRLSYAQALSTAETEARRRNWEEPAGTLFYASLFGVYGIEFFHAEDDEGVGGAGHRSLYLDGLDGRILGQREPWQGTAADIFVQAQFPVHSGRILGLPGRILISLLGLVVAMLSVTGVIIWKRKRRARNKVAAKLAMPC